jgi:hypothetical protein
VASVYFSAFTPLFFAAAVIAAIGLVAALFLKPKRLPTAQVQAAAQQNKLPTP